jgi:poly-gamma-glutamate capsule biosynthesis protein CapA/YwtB (metallophosphatase superfamily)
MRKIKIFPAYLFIFLLVLGLSSCSSGKGSKIDQNEASETTQTAEGLINNILEDENYKDHLAEISSEENTQTKKRVSKDEMKSEEEVAQRRAEEEEKLRKEKEANSKTVRIKAFGDIMAHMGQVDYAFNAGGGEYYDFSDQFVYMKDFISDADLSIGNYETVSVDEREYQGFPTFNTPSSYMKYIKEAGFDIVTNANNHSFDQGTDGVVETIKAAEAAGLDHLGTHLKKDDDGILYKEVNDIKIAFLSYTYGANGMEGAVTDYEPEEILNYLEPENIKRDIKKAKKNKADFIVVYPHRGVEYQSYPSPEQIELGREMIDRGADVVIGNHPHVVQPAERYTTEDGREGFIAYACGNYISAQSLESLGDIRTEHSVAFDITLSKDMRDSSTEVKEVYAYPLWVGKEFTDIGASIRTYICEDFINDGPKANLVTEGQLARIQQAYDMTTETINTDVE